MTVAKSRDALTGGEVEVLATLGVPHARAEPADDRDAALRIGTARVAGFLLDDGRRAHEITVPWPASARETGRSIRASPRTTRGTPPSSASRAPSSLVRIRP